MNDTMKSHEDCKITVHIYMYIDNYVAFWFFMNAFSLGMLNFYFSTDEIVFWKIFVMHTKLFSRNAQSEINWYQFLFLSTNLTKHFGILQSVQLAYVVFLSKTFPHLNLLWNTKPVEPILCSNDLLIIVLKNSSFCSDPTSNINMVATGHSSFP